MRPSATDDQINNVIEKLSKFGFGAHISRGVTRTVIGAIGDKSKLSTTTLELLPGVGEVIHVSKPYKMVSRESSAQETIIKFANGAQIGGKNILVMAGPCSVENREQLIESAEAVKKAGAKVLRGGAFKPRTSPYSFQGLGEEGLKILAEAKKKTGLPVITEVMDTRDVELIEKYADILQIGARNMQNYNLLKEVGKTNKPVLLKRGLASTLEELLMSAEYIFAEGNHQVILCERGIRTMENYTRFTLDLSAVPALKELSHLPVVVDPSHGTGKWSLVSPMAKAAIACGADGLLIEVHPRPAEAFSDGPQSLTFENFTAMMDDVRKIVKVLEKEI
jgi:3-deoxy-7-phosphoheptulonate synthase